MAGDRRAGENRVGSLAQIETRKGSVDGVCQAKPLSGIDGIREEHRDGDSVESPSGCERTGDEGVIDCHAAVRLGAQAGNTADEQPARDSDEVVATHEFGSQAGPGRGRVVLRLIPQRQNGWLDRRAEIVVEKLVGSVLKEEPCDTETLRYTPERLRRLHVDHVRPGRRRRRGSVVTKYGNVGGHRACRQTQECHEGLNRKQLHFRRPSARTGCASSEESSHR